MYYIYHHLSIYSNIYLYILYIYILFWLGVSRISDLAQEAKALLADYGDGTNTKVLTAAMQAALRCKRCLGSACTGGCQAPLAWLRSFVKVLSSKDIESDNV